MIFSVIEVNCSCEILQEINVYVIFLYLSSMRVCLCTATVPPLTYSTSYQTYKTLAFLLAGLPSFAISHFVVEHKFSQSSLEGLR